MADIFTTDASALDGYDGRHFDGRALLHTGEHAAAVYVDPASYAFEVMRHGYESGTVVEAGSAQVGLAWTDHTIVVTGRGSSEPGDWLVDLLSVVRRRWSPPLPRTARIGMGFRCQAHALCARIGDRLTQLRRGRPSAELVITGHSLGAALVPLLVSWCTEHGFPVRWAAAHSSPRVGNRAWSRWYDDRFTSGAVPTWSIVNVRNGQPDLVTRIPKRRWGFRHVGRRLILAGEKDVLFGEEAWQIYRAAHPVSSVAAWRVITRLIRSTSAAVRAHRVSELLAAERRRA